MYVQGHVEIFYNSTWGTICDDHFDNNGADVLCRMAGYASGVYNLAYKQQYATKASRIWLDDVRCVGNEESMIKKGWKQRRERRVKSYRPKKYFPALRFPYDHNSSVCPELI